MNTLTDLTRDMANLQQRQAAVLTAVVADAMGPLVREDPAMVDDFLRGRSVSGPVRLLVKEAVAAMDSTSGLAPARSMIAAFVGAVDRRSVLGQLGAVKVPSTTTVGATQTIQASAAWVGEGKPKPLSALGFAAYSLAPRKVVADVPVSAELLRFANGDALSLVERAAVSAVAVALDTALLDPANAGILNVKPASLTSGVVGTTPTGDFQNQVGQALAAISGGAPTRPVLIVSLQTALRLTGLRDLESIGVRIIVSPAAANRLIAVDADGVVYVDDGGAVRVGEPTLQLSSTPDDPSDGSTVNISAWQHDLKVIRGERWTNWAKRADAVAYVTLA